MLLHDWFKYKVVKKSLRGRHRVLITKGGLQALVDAAATAMEEIRAAAPWGKVMRLPFTTTGCSVY